MDDKSFKESVQSLRVRGNRLEREGDFWTKDEKERLIFMFYEGVGISEISIRLQRTEPAVFQQIEKLDLYQRKQYPKRNKKSYKSSGCCCPTCKAAPSLCPLCNNCNQYRRDS